eukprot:217689_1
MAALQIEGETNTGDDGDGLNELRQSLRSKKLLYIVDICREYDADTTLQSLVQWRKKDILEFIDDINNDHNMKQRIPPHKKNKFVNIIAQHAQNNELDPLKYVTSDKEERDAAKAMSDLVKDIKESMMNTSNSEEEIESSVVVCEKRIKDLFNAQVAAMRQREDVLLNDLNQIAAQKRNELNKAKEDLSSKLKEAQNVNKRINKMITMPISLDQVDKRKQTILTECDKVLKNKYNACTPVTNIIAVNANVEALQTLINRFGSVSISCIDAPVLLSVMNDGKNAKVRVRFDAKNPKKRVQMKVKWTLNSEEKEEKEQWNEKRIDNPKCNECTVCVKQSGSYQFKVSLEVADESGNHHCVESNIKSISIAQIMANLTVNRNETKVLQSDAIHRFNEVLV